MCCFKATHFMLEEMVLYKDWVMYAVWVLVKRAWMVEQNWVRVLLVVGRYGVVMGVVVWFALGWVMVLIVVWRGSGVFVVVCVCLFL